MSCDFSHRFMVIRITLQHFPAVFRKNGNGTFAVVWMEPDVPVIEHAQGGIRVQTVSEVRAFNRDKPQSVSGKDMIRLLAPLVLTKDDVDIFIKALEEVL